MYYYFFFFCLFFSFLLFLYGLRLWKVYPLPWKKTFWATLFWMLWVSSVIGYIAGLCDKEPNSEDTSIYNYAGITGYYIASQLNSLIRWGTPVLFLFLGTVFLIFVHRIRIRVPKVELPKVDISSAVSNIKSSVSNLVSNPDDGNGDEEKIEKAVETPAAKAKPKLTFL